MSGSDFENGAESYQQLKEFGFFEKSFSQSDVNQKQVYF